MSSIWKIAANSWAAIMVTFSRASNPTVCFIFGICWTPIIDDWFSFQHSNRFQMAHQSVQWSSLAWRTSHFIRFGRQSKQQFSSKYLSNRSVCPFQILGYDSLEIIPFLAIIILSFRKESLMQVNTIENIEAVLADLSSIKVLPLIQLTLSLR